MKKFSVLFGMAVFCAALIVGVGADCLAGEQEGPMKITRLGGANAFYKAKGGLTGEAFQAMCTEKKDDITTLLYEAGWQWGPEVFFAAVDAGQFEEIQFPVGGELEWMMFRKRGKPTLGYDFVWAGKKPFDALKIMVNVDDEKNCKGYVYEFVVPVACANIALYALETTPYKAEVKAALAVAPESGCVCSDFVIDATGSSATMKGKDVLSNVMGQVTMPDGTTEGLGAPDSAGVYSWKLNYRKPGTYTFKAVAVADDCDKTSAEATAVFEALPCPPVCDIDLEGEGLDELYTGEEFVIDTSGSEAKTGELDKVVVKAYLDGDKIEEYDLDGDFKKTVSYDEPGDYKFDAEAFDTCDQDSDNDCDEALAVNSRWLPFVSILGGKMRRTVWEDENFTGHCEPLVVVKGGIGYMVVPRKFEIAAALGYAFAIDNSDYSSLFADVYFNYLSRPWMVGAGLGYWNIDDSDTDDFNLILHGGYDLPFWSINDKPVQFVVEWRTFLDEMDDMGNNYAALGGFKFNF